jgi:preprotein translocase subunit SecE
MIRTREKMSAFVLVLIVVVGFMAIAFGVGYLLGKLLL